MDNMVTKCKKCGCTAYTNNGTYLAKLKGVPDKVERIQRKCKKCGHKYTVNPTIKNNPQCPYCSSMHTCKEGTINGEIKYNCADCGKHWQSESRAHRLTEHQIKMIYTYNNMGMSQRFIATLLKIGSTTVRRYLSREEPCTQTIKN